MGTITKRPQSWVYDYYNDTGAAVAQGILVLDDQVPVFGDVVEPGGDGIANAAYGKIDCAPGRVISTDQIEAGVTGGNRNDPVYSAPGVSELHLVADDGDYCVGKLVEAQGVKDYIVFQTVVPFAVSSET
jgi:hypothetical protein